LVKLLDLSIFIAQMGSLENYFEGNQVYHFFSIFVSEIKEKLIIDFLVIKVEWNLKTYTNERYLG